LPRRAGKVQVGVGRARLMGTGTAGRAPTFFNRFRVPPAVPVPSSLTPPEMDAMAFI
jgi:hypothetical protein